jgi:hypothetical protein
MAIANFTGLQLLGKSISYRDLALESLLPETLNTSYPALVVAVQVPMPDSGIESAILLREPLYLIDEYFNIEDIIVLSVSD